MTIRKALALATLACLGAFAVACGGGEVPEAKAPDAPKAPEAKTPETPEAPEAPATGGDDEKKEGEGAATDGDKK